MHVADTLDDSVTEAVVVDATNLTGTTEGATGISVNLDLTSNPEGYGVFSTTTSSGIPWALGVVGSASGGNTANRGVQGMTDGTGEWNMGTTGYSYGAGGAGTNNAGVYGYAFNNTVANYGVYGTGTDNVGTYGQATGVTVNTNYGAYGYASGSTSTNYGMYATTDGNASDNMGIYSEALGTTANSNYASYNIATGSTTENIGSLSASIGAGTDNYGVFASAEGTGTTNVGVYGRALNGTTNNYAGLFEGTTGVVGDLIVTGTLVKGGGTFKIDPPLDPGNKYLVHSFVESPDMMNIYNGNITTDENGYATVELPSYFEAANKDFRYQLTVIGTFAQAIVKEKINGNTFVIQTSEPNVEVSWQVTGVRADKWADENRVEPEVEKEKPDTYIHPELYNQPAEKATYPTPNIKPIKIKIVL